MRKFKGGSEEGDESLEHLRVLDSGFRQWVSLFLGLTAVLGAGFLLLLIGTFEIVSSWFSPGTGGEAAGWLAETGLSIEGNLSVIDVFEIAVGLTSSLAGALLAILAALVGLKLARNQERLAKAQEEIAKGELAISERQEKLSQRQVALERDLAAHARFEAKKDVLRERLQRSIEHSKLLISVTDTYVMGMIERHLDLYDQREEQERDPDQDGASWWEGVCQDNAAIERELFEQVLMAIAQSPDVEQRDRAVETYFSEIMIALRPIVSDLAVIGKSENPLSKGEGSPFRGLTDVGDMADGPYEILRKLRILNRISCSSYDGLAKAVTQFRAQEVQPLRPLVKLARGSVFQGLFSGAFERLHEIALYANEASFGIVVPVPDHDENVDGRERSDALDRAYKNRINKKVLIFPAGATLLAALATANPYAAISAAIKDLEKEIGDARKIFGRGEADQGPWDDRLQEFERELNGIVDREFPLARPVYSCLPRCSVGAIYEAGRPPKEAQDTIFITKVWGDGVQGELLEWENRTVVATIKEDELDPMSFRYGY